VYKSARRCGVASRLLERLIEAVKSENASFLFLEVRKSNEAAIKLYEKFGFLVCGERKNFYTAPLEDAYIMKLTF